MRLDRHLPGEYNPRSKVAYGKARFDQQQAMGISKTNYDLLFLRQTMDSAPKHCLSWYPHQFFRFSLVMAKGTVTQERSGWSLFALSRFTKTQRYIPPDLGRSTVYKLFAQVGAYHGVETLLIWPRRSNIPWKPPVPCPLHSLWIICVHRMGQLSAPSQNKEEISSLTAATTMLCSMVAPAGWQSASESLIKLCLR